MIIKRQMARLLAQLAQQFPVVAVMGPRQSGKTTLVREVFKEYTYITLEDIDRRLEAQNDPRKFFANYSQEKGVIIDEIQEVPDLFSYLQGIVDQSYRPGYFVITGSQNFFMLEKITQTLAGRIALLTLLPLSIYELKEAALLPDSLEAVVYKGFYPRLYAHTVDPQLWFSNYISTYVERDVRQVLKITDVLAFQRFIKLCAARVGNLINYADLARDSDVSPNTAKAWISVLEASYIIKLVHPYHKSFNKRLIKSPKLYFYDTGLMCSLLGIKNANDLFIHPLRGALFESFVISEIFKSYYNKGQIPAIYFWRDVQGHEIDCIIEKSINKVIPIEIKSGMTIQPNFFKGIIDWNTITEQKDIPAYVVYAGKTNHISKEAKIVSWFDVYTMMQEI